MAANAPSMQERLFSSRIIRFLELLTEVLGVADASPEVCPQFWAAQACALLATDLDKHVTVETYAQRMGMTADSFRRRFKREVGCSPVEHRRNKQRCCAILA